MNPGDMNETPGDEKSLEELIRAIIAMTGGGRPVIIGMQITIGGSPHGAPRLVRGDATDPRIELQTVGDRVVLSTELPGIAPEQVQILFQDDRVFVWAKDPERQYKASRKVPPVTEGSVEITCRHGLIEISYLPAPVQELAP